MKIKELGIWIGVIGVLIAGLFGLVFLVNNSSSPSTPIEVSDLPEVSDKDFVKEVKQTASESAALNETKVTLIEYGDFQCPACAAYYPLVKQLESEFPKDLRIVYRNFPLKSVHKNAMLAAQAAYAAELQNKFWEMHDILYENQDSWANINPKDTFIEYAKDLRLDMDKFTTDLDANSTKQFIDNQANTGISIGINSTPTFFVNSKKIQNPSGYDEFKKIIENEIEAR